MKGEKEVPLLLCPRAVCRSPARIDGKPPLDGKKAGKGGEEVEEQRPRKGALLSMLRLPALRAAAISRQTRHPSLGISAMAILSRLGRRTGFANREEEEEQDTTMPLLDTVLPSH